MLVLLHVYTALIPCLAAHIYYTTFWHYILQHLNRFFMAYKQSCSGVLCCSRLIIMGVSASSLYRECTGSWGWRRGEWSAGREHFSKYGRWRAGILRKKPNRTNTVMQNEVTLTDLLQALEYVHKIKMVYKREEVSWAWLLVVLSRDCFGERHCTGQKADLCRNDNKYSSQFWVMPVYWRRWRNQGFSNFTYVIIDVYFSTFESVIVSRTLVGQVTFLKGLIAATFESSEPLHLLRCVSSIPSYIRESTDSLILYMCIRWKYMYARTLKKWLLTFSLKC